MKKKTFFIILLAALALGLSACNPYTTHFVASSCAHSNASDSAFLSFGSFDGAMAFTLECGNSEGSGIEYSGKLDRGSLVVYYDDAGKKTEWFSLKAGEQIEPTKKRFKEGKVYFAIETTDKCEEGNLDFRVVE